MKNRLQIRYHIPETLPTRAQAMTYLQEAFAIGRTNSTNASLPAEPLVILYNDTQLDIANGITEAKRLETSNVLLAIGRGGDGVNVFNNQDYFVIDFAKHDEEIKDLTDTVENILEVIEEVKENIEQMKADIKKNSNDIAAIIKKIGEKGDQCEKDTVYGYIQCAHDKVHLEEDRAALAEKELQHQIEDTLTKLNNEIDDRKESDDVLQQHINDEKDARISQDEILNDAINANSESIKRVEDKFDREVGDLKTKDEELSDKIKDEEDARQDADKKHTEDIQTQREDFEAEKIFTSNERTRIEQHFANEVKRIDEDITLLQETDRDIYREISDLKKKDSEHDDGIRDNKDNIKLLQQAVDINSKEIAKNKVKSTKQTILVTPPTENGTNIEVNVDNKTIVIDEVGILSVDSSALVQYKGENAINVSDVVGQSKTISLKVNERDRIITNDDQGLLATLSLKWNHADATGEKDEIQLIGKDGIVISRIDVAEFIKDGFLDTVRLDTTDKNNPILVFVFNSAAGKETINIPVRELVDIYLAGNGLQLNEHTFSIKLDDSTEKFLTVSADGIKLSGVQSAIDTAKENLTSEFNSKLDLVKQSIQTVSNNLQTETNERKYSDTKLDERITSLETDSTDIRKEFAAADDDVRSEFTAADDKVREDFAIADKQVRTEFENADNIVRGEFTAADIAVKTAFADADNVVRNEFATADDKVRAEFATADDKVRVDFALADESVKTELKTYSDGIKTDLIAADESVKTELKTDFTNADNNVRSEFAAADYAIKLELGAKIDINKSDIESIKNDYLKSNDKNDIVNQFTVADSNLSTRIDNNENDIKVLNSGTSVDGSIKHSIYDSVIGQVVNTVTIDDASNQSLIKKFTVDDVPYIYTSNSSDDMKHNGTTLSYVINDLREDVNDANSLANENRNSIQELSYNVKTNTGDIAVLKAENAELKSLITALQTELATLKSNAITEVLGTDNEISAVKTGNSVTVKFADNAYFVAGE